jgi:hypothetical protein
LPFSEEPAIGTYPGTTSHPISLRSILLLPFHHDTVNLNWRQWIKA